MERPGSGSATIVRVITTGKPTLPRTLLATDKQMINVNPDNQLVTRVERISPAAPIFTYYGESGAQILPDEGTRTITIPRNVRSVKVSFKVLVSDGHAQRESTISSTQISLRNF